MTVLPGSPLPRTRWWIPPRDFERWWFGAPGRGCAVYTEHAAVEPEVLARQVARLREVLRRARPSPRSVLVVAAAREVPVVALMFACFCEGVPFLPLDPGEPSERWRAQAQSLGLKERPLMDGGTGRQQPTAHGVAREEAVLSQHGALHCAEHGAMPPDAALLLLTSGSLAARQCVVHTTASLAAATTASRLHFGTLRRDRYFCPLPLWHAGGVSVLLRALLARAPVVLYPEASFSGERARALIEEHEVTLASFVPTMLYRLLRAPGGTAPRAFRASLVGGAPLGVELQRDALAQGWAPLRSYGMTETFGQVATQSLADARGGGEDVGRPLAGVQIEIDDASGALSLSGARLACGYLRDAALEPLEDGGRAFVTRDRGQATADGSLIVHGRMDDVVLVGGENVDLAALHRQLEARFPEGQVVVVDLPSEEWGHRLVVAATSQPSGAPTDAEILAWIAQHLTGPVAPRHVHRMASIPRTALGKIDRKALRSELLGHLGRSEGTPFR